MKLGQKVGGGARFAFRWADIVERGLVPQYPGQSILPAAQIPSPPLVDTSKSELAQARQVAVAYRLVTHRLCGRCKHFAVVKDAAIVHDPAYPIVVEAIPHLVSLRIPPAAWVAFSHEVWSKHVRKKGRKNIPRLPPPGWVFKPERFSAHMEWFSWKESSYKGGHTWFCEEHLDLLKAYEKMKAAVLRLGDASEEEIEAAVSKTLPRSLYKKLFEAAEAKYLLQSAKLADANRRGETVWL